MVSRALRRPVVVGLSFVLAAATLLGLPPIVPVVPADAAKAPACSLVPQLRAVTINQGLGNYSPLARGKETLARLFLSKPSCASTSNTIALTGGTVTVLNGSTTLGTVSLPTPAPVNPTYPQMVAYTAAPASDAPADPKFVIPGSVLAPAATTGRFTATFRFTVTYQSKTGSSATPVNGSATFTTLTGSTTPITAVVEQRSNAIRLLIVPMGDASRTYSSQFSTAATQAVQNAMATLSRTWPVPAGVADLGATTGGIRYTINPSLLDIRSLLGSDGKFCGSGANFDALKGLLSQYLQSWNTANPTRTADRVLGAVDSLISKDSASGCAEGMAGVNSVVGWFRAIPDSAAAGGISPSGALASMELAHTLGVVPLARDDAFNPYHSPNLQADGLAPNRAYNVTLRSFLLDDRTAMTVSSGWNNTSVVYEQPDYAMLVCLLGGQTTQDCGTTQTNTVGTATGVAAGPRFVLAGTVNLVAGTADVVESYFATDVAPTRPLAGSPVTLVQLDGPIVLSNLGVPLSNLVSDHHDEDGSGDGTTSSARQVFSISFPFETGADRIELRGPNGEVLYGRDRPALSVAPTVVDVSESPVGAGVANLTNDIDHDDFDPTISSDGAWIAWTAPCSKVGDCSGPLTTESRVVIAPINDLSLARAVGSNGRQTLYFENPALIGADPNLEIALTIGTNPNGGGSLYTAPVTILEGGEPEVRDTDLSPRYDSTVAPFEEADDPSWKPDGTQVAFDREGNIWVVDDADLAVPVQLTFSGDAFSPSWSRTSGDDRIAYGRTDTSIIFFSSAPAPDATSGGLARVRPPMLEPLDDPEPPLLGQTYTVNTTGSGNDGVCDGDCSFADAIEEANLAAGLDTIEFSIGGGGAQTISLTSPLPPITSPVLIDGTSQPGYGACPDAPLIELDGTSAGAGVNGLEIVGGADGSTIQGLAINRFAVHGILIDGASTVTVRCSVIGTDPAGTVDRGNTVGGILLTDTTGSTVGGTTLADGNLVSGNDNFQISIEEDGVAPATSTNTIRNNDVGMNGAGTASIPGGSHGVVVQTSPGNQILDNVIVDAAQGLSMSNSGASGNVVQGNFIGTDRTATLDLGNTNAGIRMLATGGSNQIGGTGAGQGNVIAHNGLDGIFVDTASAEVIRGNAIFDNGGLGIDVAPDGINAGDPRPLITSAVQGAGVKVIGTGGATLALAQIDFFKSTACDASGSGEGAVYLGSMTADGAGAFTQFNLNAVAGDIITATATKAGLTTTEFSDCFTATDELLVTTTADSGAGSLRSAMTFANGLPGVDTIAFDIPGPGPHVIALSSGLPTITETVTINARTQDGWVTGGPPVVQVDGTDAFNGFDSGLGIPYTLAALSITDMTAAVILDGVDSAVVDSWIGVDLSGAAASNLRGITVDSGNANIGFEGSGNVISGNVEYGIWAVGGFVEVYGNRIGMAPTGASAIPNGAGVVITGTATAIIGHPFPFPYTGSNVIAGNLDDGVRLETAGNRVENNFVGFIGSTPVGNATGVEVDGDDNEIIDNVISGNNTGVWIDGVDGTVLNGNVIGADTTISTALGNAVSGVTVFGATNTVIGGAAAGDGNVIVANGGDGIELFGLTSGTTVLGNTIGTAAIPNQHYGIDISSTPDAPTDNVIGGVGPGEGNSIVGNLRGGIMVSGVAVRNTIRGNSIVDNHDPDSDDELGIDLGADGVTGNDGGDVDGGPNGLQNFPELTDAVEAGGVTTVSGDLDSVAGDYTIDLYTSDSCDPSDNGEGAVHVGFASVTPPSFSFDTFDPVAIGDFITATATSPTGDTSEFSECFEMLGADSLVVTTTADSGAGSLRDAMIFANTTEAQDTITFAIPGPGPHTITLLSALPEIEADLIIDGTTQAGWGPGGPPMVQVDGNGSFDGFWATMGLSYSIDIAALSITGMGSAVIFDGLAGSIIASWLGVDPTGAADPNGDAIAVLSGFTQIGGANPGEGNVISGNTGNGIQLVSAADATIIGNRIGTTPDGLAALPNGTGGVLGSTAGILAGGGSIQIGGTLPGEGNTISGNVGLGIEVLSDGVQIENNYIGVGVDGSTAIPNSGGISIEDVTGVQVVGNVISGNSVAPAAPGPFDGNGILGGGTLTGAVDTLVQGNVIGLASDGTTPVPNQQHGIYFAAPGSGNTIGGDSLGEGNIISANGPLPVLGSGVVSEAADTLVLGNQIGTDATGTLDRGNGRHGVLVEGVATSGTVVGGTAAGEANLISGNGFDGIHVADSSGVRVLGNRIGMTAGGAALPNIGYGVFVDTSVGTTIGGIAAGEGNAIKFNGNAGVGVSEFATNTVIRGNSIDLNEVLPGNALGIDIFPLSSVTLPVPVISDATESSGATDVNGTTVAPYSGSTIDFYRVPACDPTTFGEGAEWLAETPAVGGVFVLEGLPAVAGDIITATASTPGENTSEFSQCFTVTASGTPTADLSLTATALSATTVTPGDDLVIELTVTNGGPDDTPDATITANLDPDLHFDANASGFTCSEAANVLTCTTGSIPGSVGPASVTDRIVLRADRDHDRAVSTLLSFTVVPDVTITDLTPANDSDAVSYTVEDACGPVSQDCVWILDPSRADDPLTVATDDPAFEQPRELVILDARDPFWSDTGRIAFVRINEIWTADSDGSDELQVTEVSFSFDDNPAMAGDTIVYDKLRDIGEFNDIDLFVSRPTSEGGSRITGEVTPAVGIDPGTLRADLLLDCTPGDPVDPFYLVAVGVVPERWTETSAFFEGRFDPSLSCAGGVISLVATDGFLRSAPFTPASSEVVDSDEKDPVAATYAPIDGSVFLQYANIPLDGAGKDAEDGQLPSVRLDWTVSGPGGLVRNGQGPHVDLPAPVNGWPIGLYIVTLEVTDSDGRTDTQITDFTVVGDADNDGIATPLDTTTCGAAGGTTLDNDPTNASGDCDGDGIPNVDDPEPSVPAGNDPDYRYPATAVFDPQTLNIPSNGTTVTMYVSVQGRDMRQVQRNSVFITRVNGIDPTDDDHHASGVCAVPANGLRATAYNATAAQATIKFSRQTLNGYLACMGVMNRTIELRVEGGSSSPVWKFSGTALTTIKPG
jgi:hypothetical protein